MNYLKTVILLLCCTFLGPVFAADFDGSKPLICATVQARDCVLGSQCFSGHPDSLGAPQFIRIDFENKQVVGPTKTVVIISMVEKEAELVLQGVDLDFGWTFVLNNSTGKFSASLTNNEGSFLLFGACTPD